jgi:hypothetical protein
MNTLLSVLASAAALAVLSMVTPVAAAAPDPAGERCESAVADTVRRMRGARAQEVQFIGAKRAVSPTGEEEIGVKGEGRYSGPGGSTMSFAYSCAFNPKTGGTSGVLFRDTGTAQVADAAWQPDLSNLSPNECESAAAAALKDKYPRVGRIAFDPATRQLRPAPNDHTSLEGGGAVVRAPGMNAVPFSYRCEVETRSGRVMGVQTSDRGTR